VSTWSPVELTPSDVEEETPSSVNSSVSNSSDTADDDAASLVQEMPSESNITTTEQPPQPTAGKTKRDDGPANAKAADNPRPPSPPLPEPQRAGPAYRVAFAATVQHHVTAFVTWPQPEVGACDSGGVTSAGPAVVGYRLRYGSTASSTLTPVEMTLTSNVAAIDGLTPSSEYWYQLQYLFDDGSHSPWTGKQLLET